MAGDSYSYKKYQRELAQKKKKEEKLKNKLAKKNQQPEILMGSAFDIEGTQG